MALVHPELFLNIDQKVTALTFLDKKAAPTPVKILVGTSEVHLPFLCTFHFLQKSEKETEFFAKKAKNAKDFLRLFFEYIGAMQMLSTRNLTHIPISSM